MARKILIAEDHEQLAASLSRLLERQGYRVTCVSDGVAALTAIVKEPPDALVLDLRLPLLHGIELLRKLRQSDKTRELPVVIISGLYKGEKFIHAARELGVTHYLEKPFKAAELVSSLQAALDGSDAPAGRPLDSPDTPAGRPLDDLLAAAYAQGFSGRYELRRGSSVQALDFINGLPVSLRPGFSVANFGDYLLRRGSISRSEYAWYQQSGHRHASLVEMGCFPYPELLQEKLAYLTAELVQACDGEPFTVKAIPLEAPPDLQIVAVNLPRILHEACRRQTGRQGRQQLIAEHGDDYVATAPAYFSHINFLRLSAAEQELILQLDGRHLLRDLWPDEPETGQLLVLMQRLGMLQFGDRPIVAAATGDMPLRTLFNASEESEEELVEVPLESFADVVADGGGAAPLVPAQAPAGHADAGTAGLATEVRSFHTALQGKNYYQVFDLQQGSFSFDGLKERYFAITRRFGPEVLMQLGGEEAELVQEILSTVANAYNTLSDVVKKERYDEMLGSDRIGLGQQGDDRFQAQVQFQSGQVFIEMEEWDNAEKALQDACNIDPDNGSYLANLAWTIYRNPQNRNSRAMQEKARQLLGRALALERTAEGFAFKGWMHFDSGQETLAESDFNKALRLDARLLLARRGLRQLEEKREQEKKGLFRKMFR